MHRVKVLSDAVSEEEANPPCAVLQSSQLIRGDVLFLRKCPSGVQFGLWTNSGAERQAFVLCETSMAASC